MEDARTEHARMERLPLDNFRSPTALARFVVPAVLGLLIDLWTKYWAVANLKLPRRTIEFIPGWLHWEYLENHGAVFGSGQGLRWLFVAVSVAAVGFLVYLFATSGRQRFYQIVLGLLLAGVLGNLYDRLFYGYVRDMIHALPSIRWSIIFGASEDLTSWRNQGVFPWVFNVADSLLCVGVFLMIVYSLFYQPAGAAAKRPERKPEPEPVQETS